MTFSSRVRHGLVTGAIAAGAAIEWIRGYKPAVVLVSAVAFMAMGNAVVFWAGSAERALRRQQKRDYYLGLR